MNAVERRVRAHVIRSLRDTGEAPDTAQMSAALGLPSGEVTAILHALADEHRLVLRPGSDAIWMVHPFSAIESDFVVHAQGRRWFANCVWDGLAILGLVGDGWLETRSPATGEPVRFDVQGGRVVGDAIVHFLVPARRFWEDIGFT